MKNRLIDMNNHLFSQLERLSDETLNREKLDHEIRRSQAMAMIAREIISGGNLALNAQKALGNDEIQVIPDVLKLEVLPK